MTKEDYISIYGKQLVDHCKDINKTCRSLKGCQFCAISTTHLVELLGNFYSNASNAPTCYARLRLVFEKLKNDFPQELLNELFGGLL